MRFVARSQARERFEGKSVAIVGSGPGCVDNAPGFVDSHDVVVRVNNYRLVGETGSRCDVFYSFFGTSIKKSTNDLIDDGVTLCMCKCPNAHAIESEWHRDNKKPHGVDYRYIYQNRENWWFCDTYIPTVDEFLVAFRVLGNHIPTTGFSAIFDVLSFNPRSVYLTGFDFFRSKIHNVNQPWRRKNEGDPFGHVPETERDWLLAQLVRQPITCDRALMRALKNEKAVA